jgi:hypothetical protein
MVTNRKVRTPLEWYQVQGFSKPLVRPVLTLQVRTGPRRFEDVSFLVDTGAGITTMAVGRAAELGMPTPRKRLEFSLHTATGTIRQIRRPGYIKVRIPGLDGRHFEWPCHFVEHQGEPPKPTLGLAGVLDDLRITLDGSYKLDAPYGFLLVEELATDDEP